MYACIITNISVAYKTGVLKQTASICKTPHRYISIHKKIKTPGRPGRPQPYKTHLCEIYLPCDPSGHQGGIPGKEDLYQSVHLNANVEAKIY